MGSYKREKYLPVFLALSKGYWIIGFLDDTFFNRRNI